MEWINFVGLIFIAATNAWIALEVKKQSKKTEVSLILPEEYWPTVTVMQEAQELEAVPFEFDYDRLAAALASQPAPNIIVQPALPTVIPNPSPYRPQFDGPYWQSPVVSSGQTDVDTQEYITINDGTEVPVRSFPRRSVKNDS